MRVALRGQLGETPGTGRREFALGVFRAELGAYWLTCASKRICSACCCDREGNVNEGGGNEFGRRQRGQHGCFCLRRIEFVERCYKRRYEAVGPWRLIHEADEYIELSSSRPAPTPHPISSSGTVETCILMLPSAVHLQHPLQAHSRFCVR